MNALRLNGTLLLFILANILNMLFPKGMGYEEQTGLAYELSKYVYGLCIVIMLPSLFIPKKLYFNNMKFMAIVVILHILLATLLNFDFLIGDYLKTILICLSFVFFEEMSEKVRFNKIILYAFAFSVYINVSYLVLTQNRFETAIDNDGLIYGGQSIANSMVFLLPLLFAIQKGKLSSYMYLFGFLVVLVSLRRTSILAYILCAPFVFKQLTNNISKIFITISIVMLLILIWYVVSNYWYIIEMRFGDMFQESAHGTYGSGRSGWWGALIEEFLMSPSHWFQGFGLGQVTIYMANAGYPYGHAHNDYIEIGFTYGFIGLYLWFVTIKRIWALSSNKITKGSTPLIRMCVISYLFIAFVSGATYDPQFVCIPIFCALMFEQKSSLLIK